MTFVKEVRFAKKDMHSKTEKLVLTDRLIGKTKCLNNII